MSQDEKPTSFQRLEAMRHGYHTIGDTAEPPFYVRVLFIKGGYSVHVVPCEHLDEVQELGSGERMPWWQDVVFKRDLWRTIFALYRPGNKEKSISFRYVNKVAKRPTRSR